MKLFLINFLAIMVIAYAQRYTNQSSFRQLDADLPTPNRYRDATGAPGPDYWKQKVDYDIQVTLNERDLTISGSEIVTYHNNSPMTLDYIWFQLDQNIRKPDSRANLIKRAETFPALDSFTFKTFQEQAKSFDGGYRILSVMDDDGKPLKHTINGTVMRVDLQSALRTGRKTQIKIRWTYPINDITIEGRSGYEFYDTDSNYVFTIAQFFPRAAVLDDANGWQTKEFLGRGEFALEFGDYSVSITVPADHIVGATGTLLNESTVLSADQRRRLTRQRNEDKVAYIVTPTEAEEAMNNRTRQLKTWKFRARNVRDFAFASSRRFIWDAASVQSGKRRVLTMSLYPKEGMPLWDKYSTHLVRHTIQVYNRFTFDYPYETCISVHASDKIGGMEYPMISFNGGRPNADGSFSKATRDFMILVIIHEVGHNYFPMIVSSDERQWTWMDEGLNSFLQYLAEREWDPNFDSQAGPADLIVDYMKMDADKIVPIMTQSDAILRFGSNSYDKPTAGLNILRETILGRELFDFALKRYANLWKFKHPNPADFFRVMEDASGRDLDWFWRGWFYTTKYVNQSIDKVTEFRVQSDNPKDLLTAHLADSIPPNITDVRNNIKDGGYAGRNRLSDKYSDPDPYRPDLADTIYYKPYYESLSDDEKAMLKDPRFFYRVEISNVDDRSMVMPIILQMTFSDSSKQIMRIPAEAWLKDEKTFAKAIITTKKVIKFELDPLKELPDIDRNDNIYPRTLHSSEFYLYKSQGQ